MKNILKHLLFLHCYFLKVYPLKSAIKAIEMNIKNILYIFLQIHNCMGLGALFLKIHDWYYSGSWQICFKKSTIIALKALWKIFFENIFLYFLTNPWLCGSWDNIPGNPRSFGSYQICLKKSTILALKVLEKYSF